MLPNKGPGHFILLALIALTSASHAQVDFKESRLPIIHIVTGGKEILDDPRIPVQMSIIYKGEGEVNHVDDFPAHFQGQASIEIRGSTSQEFPKKSYSFETQEATGENLNVSLLDMPQENDWVLYAPYSDKSLIRNILAYTLSRELGHYAPRCRLCELVLDGNYKGVYVLVEKIKRDANRVDIARLDPDEITGEDLTGGYILKIDKQTGDSGPVWTSREGGIYFQYEYPDYDEIVPEQKTYIKAFIDQLESALKHPDFSDSLKSYRQYLDESSAVDMFIVNEISKNIDAYMLSTFLYKTRDSRGGKIFMGPVWDYNLAFGNADYREGYSSKGFQLEINQAIWWWDRLMADESFVESINKRWYAVRDQELSDTRIMHIIDSLAHMLEEAQVRNFEQWDILGRDIWPNYFVGNSYQEEMEYLKEWTGARLRWLDEHISIMTGSDSLPHDVPASVYPNPFSSRICYTVDLQVPTSISIDLYDIQGRLVRKLLDEMICMDGKQEFHWQMDDLESGIYLLVLRDKNRILGREKILKVQDF